MRIVLAKRPLLALLITIWIAFLVFSFLDGQGLLGLQDIGTKDSLLMSQIARSLFVDMTLLSLFCAGWIMWDGYHSRVGKTLAVPFALLTMFVGSAGFFLYLIMRVWSWEEEKWVVIDANFKDTWGPLKVKKYK